MSTNIFTVSMRPAHWSKATSTTQITSRKSVTCNLESHSLFRRRLENKGWEINIPSTQNKNPLVSETWQAAQEIYGLGILETTLQPSPWLIDATSASDVHLKLETQQITGSFKARGAAHKILSLLSSSSPQQQITSVVTSSTGNHALGILHACSALSSAGKPITATIFVPSTLSPVKASKLKATAEKCNATIIATGIDCIEAETAARHYADTTNQPYISPYNDIAIAGGQGTIGLELCLALEPTKLDAVFVPVGGGGLISGIAAFLKSMDPSIRIIGCQPANSNVMQQSIEAGRILDDVPWQETLSDGTAGGIEENSITFDICRQYVDDWVTVEEHEIAKAMVGVQRHHGIQIEGSAGVAVASYIKVGESMRGKHVVIVCCGGNVSQETYEKAYTLVREDSSSGRGSSSGGGGIDSDSGNAGYISLERKRKSKEGSAAAF